MSHVFGPLTYLNKVSFGMWVVVLGGGALKGVHQCFAVTEHSYVATCYVVMEVT